MNGFRFLGWCRSRGDYTIANPRPGHSEAAKHRGEYFELLGPAKTGKRRQSVCLCLVFVLFCNMYG